MSVSDTIRLYDDEDFSEDYPTSKVLEAVAYTFGIDPTRLRAIAEAERDGCTYKQEEWEEMIFTCSHCGETWCYDCGNPFENNQNFCGHCGYPIKAIVVLDRDDDWELVEKTVTREAAEAAAAAGKEVE